MKKIFVSIASLLMSAVLVSAQDINAIIELYNTGASALSNGEKAGALASFQKALDEATALGEAGNDVANNCKQVIPDIYSSMANDLVKGNDFDGAIAKLLEGKKFAEKTALPQEIESFDQKIRQFTSAKAAKMLQVKDFAGAAGIYKAILEADPTDGMSALRLGTACSGMGDLEAAAAAFEQAAANGQKEKAYKQLATINLKSASAALKGKDYDKAIEMALKATEFNPNNATAFKIAGTAANFAKKKEEAVKYLSKYLELSPNAADAAQISAAIKVLSK